MLENLLQLVRESAGDAIIENPQIPNEQNDEAISATTNSIFNTLKGQVAENGVESLTSMFSRGTSGSGNIMEQVSSNTVTDLMNRFGIDSGAATNIAAKIIPTVMDKFVNKTNDPNDNSFDLQEIIGSLTGGSGGILDSLKGIFGR